MKKQEGVIWLSTVVLFTAGAIFLLVNQKQKRRTNFERQEIADEGYEFAADILFPLESQRKKSKRKMV